MIKFIVFRNVLSNISIIRQRYCHQTHYEVLGLSKNCTRKEIKDAFITLSKKYHPDKATATNPQKDFVKIIEAYSILSKPHLRRNYDWKISSNSVRYQNNLQKNYYDSSNLHYGWKHRTKNNGKETVDDVPRKNKLSNGQIAGLCILIGFAAGVLQLFAIRHSIILRQEKMKQNLKAYEQLRSEIELLTKEEQLARIENLLGVCRKR